MAGVGGCGAEVTRTDPLSLSLIYIYIYIFRVGSHVRLISLVCVDDPRSSGDLNAKSFVHVQNYARNCCTPWSAAATAAAAAAAVYLEYIYFNAGAI